MTYQCQVCSLLCCKISVYLSFSLFMYAIIQQTSVNLNYMTHTTKTSFSRYSEENAVIEDCTGMLTEGKDREGRRKS